jgi:hypothetical protein
MNRQYITEKTLKAILYSKMNIPFIMDMNPINFIELQNETSHQVETIQLGLKSIGKDISFLIKDCDNSFNVNVTSIENNFVSYCKLENLKGSDVASKSYLQLDTMDVISNIVEKKVISDKFCCGGYYFKSSYEFLEYSNIQSSNSFVSDVVFNMILNGKTFVGMECSDYEDWGTMIEWQKYKNTFKTLLSRFCFSSSFNKSQSFQKPSLDSPKYSPRCQYSYL